MLRAKQPIATSAALRKIAVGRTVSRMKSACSGRIVSWTDWLESAGIMPASTVRLNRVEDSHQAGRQRDGDHGEHLPQNQIAARGGGRESVSKVLRSFSRWSRRWRCASIPPHMKTGCRE